MLVQGRDFQHESEERTQEHDLQASHSQVLSSTEFTEDVQNTSYKKCKSEHDDDDWTDGHICKERGGECLNTPNYEQSCDYVLYDHPELTHT